MKKFWGVIIALAVLVALMIPAAAPVAAQVGPAEYIETLYLSNTLGDSDGYTQLYEVVLDDVTPKADLIPLADVGYGDGIIPFNHADAIACTPDGKKIYAIDDANGNTNPRHIGVYDLEVPSWTDLGVLKMPNGTTNFMVTDQLAFAADGTLYVTRNEDDSLYWIDLDPLSATYLWVTLVGQIRTASAAVDVYGADIVFDENNYCYMWTVNGRTGAPAGLYGFDLITDSPGVLNATFLGAGSQSFTGLAIRGGGAVANPLLGSRTDTNAISIIDETDGTLGTQYPMYLGGSPYSGYIYGDMTVGALALEIQEALTVSKTADTSFTRTHNWSIDKSVDTELGYLEDDLPKIWLFVDGRYDETATWTVDVTYLGNDDSDWNVSGTITIENTGLIDTEITSVVDELAGNVIVITWLDEFDEPLADQDIFPYTLAAGATLTGTYSEDGYVEGTNEVTVLTEANDVDGYFADAEIIWGDPTTEIDASVEVTDTNQGFYDVHGPAPVILYAADYEEGDVETFTYTKDYAWEDYNNLDETDDYTYVNTAEIYGEDTGWLDDATATLKVNVQGYYYETAFAKGDDTDEGVNQVVCFYPDLSRWGWTMEITEEDEYTWDLWAGAAQCDTTKGTLVGTVHVNYADGLVDVTIEDSDMFDYFILDEYIVYAGDDMFPMVKQGKNGMVATVAPGQYYNVGDVDEDGTVWVIVHAVVGIPDPNFGPPAD